MQTTMTLLDAALSQQPAPFWTEKLQLSRGALHTAKTRGHLSPAIAGVLAEELGEDMQKWIVIAALESERDSACKNTLLRKIRNWLFCNAQQRAKHRQAFTVAYA